MECLMCAEARGGPCSRGVERCDLEGGGVGEVGV